MPFAAILGHQTQIEHLRRLRAADRLPHALLFAGPAGIGKRLVADALAGALMCEAGGEDACGVCAGCRQLAAGSHPDVTVVAVPRGKREIPIDHVREFIRFLRLQPLRGTRKLAVIDDAHLLNLPAQNALLKSLEEPPQGSLIVLVVSNAEALLPTVRSRCQRLLFAPLPEDTVAGILASRCGIDEKESRALAAMADGSPGRALRLHAALPPATRDAVLNRLARLEGARYGLLVHSAAACSGSDEMAATAMDTLLAGFVRAAGSAARAGDAAAAGDEVRRAEAVVRAARTLQRRNPNRQLLIESLFLELARR